MTILQVLEYPDARLRQASSRVSDFDDNLATLADDMLETMYASKAIGLSAPQVNVHVQLLVMDLSADQTSPQVYINPEILTRTAQGFVEEGCMSLPGIAGNVIRATQLRARAQDLSGNSFERELSDMQAVCLQHEMDHLDGKLFIDRLSPLRRFRIRRAAKAQLRREDRPVESAAL